MQTVVTDSGEWSFERPISGGVGYFDRQLFLGGADGTVFSLSAEDGSPLWEVGGLERGARTTGSVG